MTEFLDLSGYQRWDFAGVDGLQFAQALFGEASGRIAPFQSFDQGNVCESSGDSTFCRRQLLSYALASSRAQAQGFAGAVSGDFLEQAQYSLLPGVLDSNENRCRLNGYRCSVLRLGEGNFRISLQGDATAFEQAITQLQPKYQVWVKRSASIGAIALPETLGLNLLPQIAIPKPPHRLEGLQCNRAAPTRIDGISVLIWLHQVLGQSAFELHTAIKDVEAIRAKLNGN